MRNSGPLVIIMHENLTCTWRKGFEQINSDTHLLKAEIYWSQMTENTRTHFLYESLCFRSALISKSAFLSPFISIHTLCFIASIIYVLNCRSSFFFFGLKNNFKGKCKIYVRMGFLAMHGLPHKNETVGVVLTDALGSIIFLANTILINSFAIHCNTGTRVKVN